MTTRIVILGGGSAGLTTALELQKRRPPQNASITLVDQAPYFTYQPFLPEVAGGHIAPRDVTVPLRKALRKTKVVEAAVSGHDRAAKTVSVTTGDGVTSTIAYDQLVVALGAVTRTFPTPGLAENGVGFKSVEEAQYVRDRILGNIAEAASVSDPATRRKLLTVVFVGGGYTGVEAMAELDDAAKAAVDSFPNLSRDELRFVLVEALDRVAPEVGPELSKWTLGHLRSRGIDIRLKTTMPSCIDGDVVLSDGETIPAGTIVWTAGVKPNPVLADLGLPLGPRGHVNVSATLQVQTDEGDVLDGVWSLGDGAQVPNLLSEQQPAYYPPNAQNAVRQAVTVADNIIAQLSGQPIAEYRHESVGTVASFGIGKGAANIKDVKMKNVPAWLAHRGYHLYAMPTLNRKWRILTGWITNFFGGRDQTPLVGMADPRAGFLKVTPSVPADGGAKKKK
ncbi:NAD(P)/FAD-dependent oxidoreductase [Frigoribacterium sp. CFBP9039]|uniref:NAD(P)/FAD-dependent oxidoreductase n=1 Tax=Frigoribacterium TaxID=96492 RepID=UPI001781C3F4|nr:MULTISPECIES: NAD(P)/FAD-dependent oxidoreductase [Frigoribacterium]MBD8703535.1 NAD(P)/FAD-dependent oxidoreductase [Frigoribacterium sp. CFBP 13712]MCJ0699654.1 NAD(P)/FAD-dependent oxidoreductase [Frigoribacterium faeni]MDY0890957.1 NAD(P)/FAD-dependent oxidoreductase [Frigoribacterium sp. CFBP9030]MDY0945084.1 NAD(P)/FAD-dependent oxidoreductase [Frigoribacterium sp. CFBP9039]